MDGWKRQDLLYMHPYTVFVLKTHTTATSQHSSLPKYTTRTLQRILGSRKLFAAPHGSVHITNVLQPCQASRPQCPRLNFVFYAQYQQEARAGVSHPQTTPQGQLGRFRRAAQAFPKGKGPERSLPSVGFDEPVGRRCSPTR